MSYTPTTWATGDVITAEKLNKLEGGVANAGSGTSAGNAVVFEFTASKDPDGGFIVSTTVTYNDVRTEMLAGKLCVARVDVGAGRIYYIVFSAMNESHVEGSYTEVSSSGSINIAYTSLMGYANSGWVFDIKYYNAKADV